MTVDIVISSPHCKKWIHIVDVMGLVYVKCRGYRGNIGMKKISSLKT